MDKYIIRTPKKRKKRTDLFREYKRRKKTTDDDQIWKKLFLEAESLFDENRYQECLSKLNECILLHPNCREGIYFFRACVHEELGNGELCLENLNTSLTIKPDFLNAYLYICHIYKEEKKYDKCLEGYSQALSYYPNNAKLLYKRGKIYYFLRDYEKGLVDCNKSISLDDGNYKAYLYRSKLHRKIGNYEQCVLDQHKLIELRQVDTESIESSILRKNGVMKFKESFVIVDI